MYYHQPYLIALGSNLGSKAGDNAATLSACLQEFSENHIQLKRVSRYFASPAFPKGCGPDYVNATASVLSPLSPHDMLDALHRIERGFDRKRENRWAARTLDLDLLACGDTVLPSEEILRHWMALPADQQRTRTPAELILPHPRLQDRNFVLIPLCDIDANWRHPILGATVQTLRNSLPAEDLAEITPI